jgi:hypothetical protein
VGQYRVDVDMEYPERGDMIHFWVCFVYWENQQEKQGILASYLLYPHILDYVLTKLDQFLKVGRTYATCADVRNYVGNLMNYVRSRYPAPPK